MGLRGGTSSEDYVVKTKWDAVIETLVEDSENRHGDLMRDENGKIYGIRVLEVPITFQKIEGSGVRDVWHYNDLPYDVELYKIALDKKIGRLLD